jgi:hypothetical protein
MRAHGIKQATSIAIVTAFAIVISACGGDDDESATEDGAAASAEDVETTTAPVGTQAPPTEPTIAPTSAPSTTEPGATTVPPSPVDSCDPFGPLKTYELNDRCAPEGEGEPAADPLGQAFAASDLAWRVDECPGMVAVPNQLLIVTDDDDALLPEIDRVAGVLDPAGITVETSTELADNAALLDLTDDDTIPVGAVLSRLPLLQGDGTSVDLNYLEPVLPNNIFRPHDDPVAATQQQIGDFTGASFTSATGEWVAVIDSTEDGAMYDQDPSGEIGHGYIDQDHGHGRFVKSIIDRTGATVTLYSLAPNTMGPSNPSVLSSGRWAPMAIQDADIVDALDSILNSESLVTLRAVNMSLGGVGCPAGTSEYLWGIGERLPLARKMRQLLEASDALTDNDSDVVKFVAAAGNNGENQLHFPAAWRNDAVTVGLVDQTPTAVEPTTTVPIDPNLVQGIVTDIQALHTALEPAIIAVGSVNADGSPSEFTNCGDWVNAAAFGNQQVGVYPVSAPGGYTPPDEGQTLEYGPDDYAVWSGTSFATANFTAAFVSNHALPDAVTGARMTGAGGLPCP